MNKRWKQWVAFCLTLFLVTGCAAGGSQDSAHEISSITYESSERSGGIQETAISLSIGGTLYEGTYTGRLVNDLPEGKGTFTSGEFMYQGTFAGGSATDGKLTKYPLTLQVDETMFSGVYNDDVTGGAITGTGSFDADSFTYRGTFTDGVPTGSGQVSGMTVSLQFGAKTFAGIYRGEVMDLLPQGNGSFERQSSNENEAVPENEHVKFEGSFENGAALTGTLTNCPADMTFGDMSISGRYDGPFTDGAINGEGRFASDTLSYAGGFEANVPTGNGRITGYPYTLMFQDYGFTGVYEGDIKAFLPDGSGVFDAPQVADGVYLNFTGTFAGGALMDGTLDTNQCTVYTVSREDGSLLPHTGSYQGGLAGGVPNGSGHFAGKGTNFPYEYDAEFHDGKPTGLVAYTYHLPEGDLVWEKERQEGVMIFRSIVDYLANLIVEESDASKRVPLSAYEFIKTHQTAFNGLTGNADLKAMADARATYDKVYADPAGFSQSVIKFSNYKIEYVEIYQWSTELDELLITATSEANGNHALWLRALGPHGTFQADQFKEGQVITVWGVVTTAFPDDRENVNYQYLIMYTFAIE